MSEHVEKNTEPLEQVAKSIRNGDVLKIIQHTRLIARVKSGVVLPKFVLNALPDTEKSAALAQAADMLKSQGS